MWAIDDLKKDLLDTFAGQRLTMKKIYEEHNVDTPYIKKNYKSVLRALYDEGTIEAVSLKGKPPRKNSFAETIIVTFPR